jgi:hypothetical protein
VFDAFLEGEDAFLDARGVGDGLVEPVAGGEGGAVGVLEGAEVVGLGVVGVVGEGVGADEGVDGLAEFAGDVDFDLGVGAAGFAGGPWVGSLP